MKRSSGIATLESAVFVTVFAVLLCAGWGIAAFFGEAAALEAAIENRVSGHSLIPFLPQAVSGDLRLDSAGIERTLDRVTAALRSDLAAGFPLDSEVRIESAYAVADIDPVRGTLTGLRIETRPVLGGLSVGGTIRDESDIRLVMQREIDSNEALLALPDGGYDASSQRSFLSRVVLIGVTASVRLAGHPASTFLPLFAESPYLVRSRISMPRRQL